MSLRRSLRALGEQITRAVGPGIYRLVGEDAVKLHLGNVSGLANDDCGGVVFYLGVTTCTRTQQQECAGPGERRIVVWGWGRGAPSLGWAGRRRASSE